MKERLAIGGLVLLTVLWVALLGFILCRGAGIFLDALDRGDPWAVVTALTLAALAVLIGSRK